MCPDVGRTWTNVFNGTRRTVAAVGGRAKGSARGGMMTLTMHGVDEVTGFTRAARERWIRRIPLSQPCNAT